MQCILKEGIFLAAAGREVEFINVSFIFIRLLFSAVTFINNNIP